VAIDTPETRRSTRTPPTAKSAISHVHCAILDTVQPETLGSGTPAPDLQRESSQFAEQLRVTGLRRGCEPCLYFDNDPAGPSGRTPG